MFAGLENPIHLLVILLVVLLVFGPKRLPDMGRSLGHGIRELKGSLAGDHDRDDASASPPEAAPEPQTRLRSGEQDHPSG